MSAMGATKVAWKLFLAWEDEKEERWLEEMARAGWQLESGGIRFRFRRAEPRDSAYRLDFHMLKWSDRDEYFTLFRDAGWEHVDSFGNWHYFRALPGAPAREIYTDTESRVQKYRRLQLLIVLVLAMNVTVIANPRIWRSNAYRLGVLVDVAHLLQLGCILLLAYAAWRLHRRVRRLRARPPLT